MNVPDELTASFPFATVVFPGDELNLHSFEPRYQELINDCAKMKMPFGIPAVVDRQIGELGTLVERVLPVVAEMESLKEKIQLNGHFKYLPAFDV
jgi:Lon protease-like protein